MDTCSNTGKCHSGLSSHRNLFIQSSIAYLKSATKHNKSTTLTSLPPLLSLSLAITDPRTPILSELAHSSPLTDPADAATVTREPTKRRVQRTLDTCLPACC